MPDPARRRQLELFAELLLEASVPGGIEAAQVVEVARHGEPVGQLLALRDVADVLEVPGPELHGRCAEHRDVTAIGSQDVHQQADRRGLAGAVGPDQREHRAFGNLQAQVFDCVEAAEVLGEVVGLDDHHYSFPTAFTGRSSRQVSSTACFTSPRPAPTRMASTTSFSTSSSSRRLRSPGRAFGGCATTVPTPGCTSSQRSWTRCWTTLCAVFGWIFRSIASVRTDGKDSPAFSSPARMDLMAAKQTWSKIDWPGLNLTLNGTMRPPVSHVYCDTSQGVAEPENEKGRRSAGLLR